MFCLDCGWNGKEADVIHECCPECGATESELVACGLDHDPSVMQHVRIEPHPDMSRAFDPNALDPNALAPTNCEPPHVNCEVRADMGTATRMFQLDGCSQVIDVIALQLPQSVKDAIRASVSTRYANFGDDVDAVVVDVSDPVQRENLCDAVVGAAGYKLGRAEALKQKRCTKCGGNAAEFKDKVSQREYLQTAWCQKCQDEYFGPD